MATRAQRPVFWQVHINGCRRAVFPSTATAPRTTSARPHSPSGVDAWASKPGLSNTPRRELAPLVGHGWSVLTDKATNINPAPSGIQDARSPATARSANRQEPKTTTIEIRLRGGRTISIARDFDDELVTRLIRLLEGLPISVTHDQPC